MCKTKLSMQVTNATTYEVILGNDWLHEIEGIIDISQEVILTRDKETQQEITHPISIFKESQEEFEKFEEIEEHVYFKREDTPEAIAERIEKADFYDEPGSNWNDPNHSSLRKYKDPGEKLEEIYETKQHTSLPEEYRDELENLLEEKEYMFAEDILGLGKTSIYKHKILVPPTYSGFDAERKYSKKQKEFMKEEVEKLLKAGVIEPAVNNPYNSAPVIVEKKNGKLRMCIDYRKLNKATHKDKYPLPRIQDLLDSFHGAKYFSTLDLASGYWQMEIEEASIPYTAFKVERGHYVFRRMPFGLTNAPSSFQRLMDRVLEQEMGKFVQVYLDDIIIYSGTWEEHLDHIKKVLERLEEAGLKLGKDKCFFGKEKLEFLGHVISEEGIDTDPKKIEKIKNWPTPTEKKHARQFMGLIGYYRKFIKDCSIIAKPIYNVMGKNKNFQWGEKQQKAMDELKKRIIDHVVLKHPDFSKPFILQTDGSSEGLGAVLSQIDKDGHERPIHFASQTLTGAQNNYSASELELLAVYWALIYVFKQYLLDQEFTLETDHRAITGILEKKGENRRLLKWLMDLQPYLSKMTPKYRPGTQNANADALSRRKADDRSRSLKSWTEKSLNYQTT